VELGRKLRPDPSLDGRDEIVAAQAGVMADSVRGRVAVAEFGQEPGQLDIGLELAFEEHAIEIEDDRCEAGHSSSNRAVPIRTAVAPSITAVSKSPDIPMLKPVTS
jgi:hypothetical protein